MRFFFTLRVKLFLAIIGINLIAIIAIAVIFYKSSAQFLEHEYAKALIEYSFIGAKNLDQDFQTVYHSAVIASLDPEIKQALDNFQRFGQDRFLLTAAETLQKYKSENHRIDLIYLFLPNSEVLIKSSEYKPIQRISANLTPDWTALFQPTGLKQTLAPVYITDTFSVVPKPVFMYLKPIEINAEQKAWLAVLMDERRIYYNHLDSIAREHDINVYLVNQDRKIVSSSNRQMQRDSFLPAAFMDLVTEPFVGKAVYQQDGTEYLGVYNKSSFSGYYTVLLAKRDNIIGRLLLLQYSIVSLAVAVLFLSLIPAYYMARRVNKPIENLKQAMERISYGDLTAQATVYGHDEIGSLSAGFNDMVSHIRQLVEDLVTERTLKKQAELNALQYQIRPHFIYNTLNSIRFVAIMQGQKNIGSLLGKFIDLLQVSSNRKGSFASLRDELDTLKKYIALQQFRRMDSFTVAYRVDEAVLDYCAPRLILQPLVENSIVHGPSGNKPICHVTIGAELEQGCLVLYVEDDGKGMTREEIAAVYSENSIEKGEYTHIGIFNIRERLRLYYGGKGKLEYVSDGRTFTRAIIHIPASKDPRKYEL